MEKYSFELKCQVVQDYLSGVGSIAFIANKYSIPAKSNVEKWINLYNSQGSEVLKTGKVYWSSFFVTLCSINI